MNRTIDIDETATDDGGGLDPRSAALLLKQTDEQARRQLTARPPWLRLFVACLVFFIYGCLYMAARGQHRYVGPHGTWLAIMVVVLVMSSVVRLAVFGRAFSGVTGTSARRLRGVVAAIVAALVCVYVLDGALYHAHVGKAIVLGVFDASGPIVVLAAIWAAVAAMHEDWWALGSAIALMGVVTGAAFAGPVGVWGVIAVGGCLVLLPQALVPMWLERR